MTHGVAATAGHLADNGGIRGHSAGEVFPFVIYQQGTFNELHHWVLQPNGLRIGPFEDHASAENTAKHLKLHGQLPRTVEKSSPDTMYYVDHAGLSQAWRWRILPDAAPSDLAEVTHTHGAHWYASAYTVEALRKNNMFSLIGTDPKWQAS